MAVRGLSLIKSQKPSRGFMTVLQSAALEWLLMSMLFINAIFSYMITKFARHYELPIPCLLCSRLDHLFGGESAGYYWDLFCGDHKSEISSLVLCNHHDKLVDVHGVCESCLFSFATTDKSNAETYRLLVGKLGAGYDADFDEDPLQDDDHKPILSSTKRCSCCNELWTSRSHAQELLLQTKSTEFEANDLDVPLRREFRENSSDLKKESEQPCWSAASSLKEGNIDASLPHFGYTELKINSDTESEVQMSENEDPRALTLETSVPQENEGEESPLMEPHVTISDGSTIYGKPSVPKTSELLSWEQSEIIHEPHNDPYVSLTRDIGHGLEELDWQQIDHKLDSSPLDDLINVNDDVPESSNAGQFSVDPPEDSTEIERNREVVQPVVDERSNFHGTENAPTTTDTTTVSKTSFVDLSDGGSQNISYLDLVDAYKLAVSGRGRQMSGKLIDLETEKDSTRSEDLKVLLSQLSAVRGLELPQFDMPSPGVRSPRLRSPGVSTSIGLQILQKRISLERNDSRISLDRNESGFESLDFSSVGEIEGESDIDKLRRQVEHDKKLLSSLWRELEEERNASAIAANQAMAMITRLQEEKAALQMGALQDLRMLEEEAEYDMEALQKANDLIVEKDKEIQDLEAELEFYRSKYTDDLASKNAVNTTSDLAVSRNPINFQDYCVSFGENKEDSSNNSLEFEDERLYIAQCLGQLEKKLYQYSNNGAHTDLTKGEEVDPSESKSHKDGSRVRNEVEDENVSMPRDRSHALIRRVQSFKTLKSFGPGSLAVHKGGDIVALGHEVSNLNDRLQTLEADRRFLQYTINSLRNGHDGLNLIQEIASHLRELRRAGVIRKPILT